MNKCHTGQRLKVQEKYKNKTLIFNDQIISYFYVDEFIFDLNSLSFQTELTLKLITNELWKSKW